ncbi:hypothetical protein LWC08_14035 [Desulfobaculum bizertense]|uniref:hypothetical protein n=1 Tax=Desulfobaculum bizertense TaxID=376490 RepID=UPI001F25A4BC|nr:hypothetical protein [Desulfobaculum bizertense]UIJ37793.1 hypothetical protein LWC08_14035 [Desulfobaculum bizertense]
MNPQDVEHSVFVPIPVRGMRQFFLVNGQGFVRVRADSMLQNPCPWLCPDFGEHGIRGPLYTLRAAGKKKEISVRQLLRALGKPFSGVNRAWFRDVCTCVEQLNARYQNLWESRQSLNRMERESIARMLHKSANFGLRTCPWASGQMEGSALGADPVLGF